MPSKEDREARETIKNLRTGRSVYRRKITLLLKQLKEMKNKNALSDSLTNNLRSKIEKEMNQVQQFNEKINDVMVQSELESVDESFYVSEVEDQIKYDVDIEIELDLYAVTNQNQASGLSGVAQSYVTSQDLINLMSQMSVGEGRPPPLNCGTFTGKEKDKFAFNTFLNQFNNVIGSRKQLTDATKLASWLSEGLCPLCS